MVKVSNRKIVTVIASMLCSLFVLGSLQSVYASKVYFDDDDEFSGPKYENVSAAFLYKDNNDETVSIVGVRPRRDDTKSIIFPGEIEGKSVKSIEISSHEYYTNDVRVGLIQPLRVGLI